MNCSLRLVTLLLVVLFGPAVHLWVSLRGMTHLHWAYPFAAVFWLSLGAVWYLVFGRAPLRRRLGIVGAGVGVFFVLAVAAGLLVRYEGSASGSSFPELSWVWEEPDNPGLDAPAEPTEVTPPAPRETLRAAAADVKQFLGPGRDGMWEEPTFGVDWSSDAPELIWRRPVGKAWSSFVVAGEKAITQEQVGDAEHVTCLDLFTGETLWRHVDPDTGLLLVRKENAGAAMGGDGPRSTPAIHDGRVYSLGATGILNCLDLETGEERWAHDVVREHDGRIQRWGMAAAPLVLPGEGLVVVVGSGAPGATLVAYDLESGEEAWVHEGNGAGYSSPRLLRFFGVPQIVSANAHDVTGLNPATGELLWRHEWPGNYPKVGQPQRVGDDRILVSASYGMGALLLRLSEENGEWDVERLWKSIRLKTKFSSASIRDGYAYGLDEGRLACIDLETGDKVWKKEKFGFGQQLLFGEHLLVQAERGLVVVGAVGPEGFTETGRIEALDGMTWNVPAVAGRILLVRNDQEAACYLLPEGG